MERSLDLRRVADDFAVAPQLQPADMAAVSEAGFTTVICNRPDGEEAGQPTADSMRKAAEAAGMTWHFVPVSGGIFPTDALRAFRKIRHEAEGPVLAFCRTGTRSITLDTLANPDGLAAAERLRRASAAGYDLSALAPSLN